MNSINTTTSSLHKSLLLSSIVLIAYYLMEVFNVYNVLFVWILIEIAFYVHFIQKRHDLQKITKPVNPLTRKSDRIKLFWNCVHTIKNITTWAEGWFYYKSDFSHPKFQDIKRDNLALWFAWAFWHDDLNNVIQNEEWKQEIDWMITTAEKYYNIQFPIGFNSELECIRLNLDPVKAMHRPFFVYFFIYITTTLFNILYLQLNWNFNHSSHINSSMVWGNVIGYLDQYLNPTTSIHTKKMSYYYRSGNQSKTPIVFIHGIGAGIICYTEFLHQLLLKHPDRPFFLIELPYVSMHMVDQIPSAHETVKEITDMLNQFGFDKAIFISHSLGTGVTSWIMNINPDIIGGLIMIDPICFLLHYHHVAFNFVHRIPKKIFEYIIQYFASSELYISHYISRHFQWFETIYFIHNQEDYLLNNTCIFLSEKDSIVGSLDVYKYLVDKKVNVYIMNHLEHAMFLISQDWKNLIFKQLDKISSRLDI